eukprot:CAMPEP_0194145412 /NCGR_PEP_ID=MMETSP0152-20130528/17410_1 /TAXON_ID=1049557 /ORGANISM="Thalassiothrix antarctica, Strain L6-D1" /LENGTH=498 /DNA_ID=CAMNT_0038845643 /DNA_START=36 /DNA_END=1532 /DNA_ORIENTATION=-
MTTILHSRGNIQGLKKEFEVDFDKNITNLYQDITDSNWDAAIEALESGPHEARTWVVRYYEGSDEIMWRFLPLHSACARQPPASVISALLNSYPEAARCIDDQGMYPLHYASGNQASREVIRLLLVANPQAAKIPDPRGMLPIHYLACWGPSTVSIIDMVLVAHRDVAKITDEDGNTPMDLAKDGEYPEKDAVIEALKRWFERPKLSKLEVPSSPSPSLNKTTSPMSTKSESYSSRRARKSPITSKRDPSPAPSVKSLRSVSDNISFTQEADTITVARLREELSKLRTDQRKREQDWEEKMDDDIEKLKSKCADMEKKLVSTTTALKEANDRVEFLEVTVQTNEEQLKERDYTILKNDEVVQELNRNINHCQREFDDKVSDLESERNDLRLTLTEVSEHCEIYKTRATNMNDRIGSLSVSLSSMMDQQSGLVKVIQEREMLESNYGELRRQKLKDMLKVEEKMLHSLKNEEHQEISSAFETQGREMDAIAAVISAIRD